VEFTIEKAYLAGHGEKPSPLTLTKIEGASTVENLSILL